MEIGDRFRPILKGLLGDCDNLTLVHGDVMSVDLDERLSALPVTPTVVVANIPYYITTPIVERLHESTLPLRSLTLTIQDEVARRYTAEPGHSDYGSISVVLRYWGDPTYCARVSKRCFLPRPQVDSAIVHIPLHDTPPVGVASEELFYHVVRQAFNKRRKMMRNALAACEGEGYDTDAALAAARVDPTARPGTLSLEDFARLSDALLTTSAAPSVTEPATDDTP